MGEGKGQVKLPEAAGPIGVFDSGYGGLTVLRELVALMPHYDYLYLGDNARAPYGTRSFDLVCEFTWQAVERLFQMGCHLVILACNTASAKALRTIQQQRLPSFDPQRRVLGVIRPTAECVGEITKSRSVGVLATPGTVRSRTYELEIAKLSPDIKVTSVACPMWVPLVETGEQDSPGADYFVKKPIDELLRQAPKTDAIILGCTHYPLLLPKIRRHTPEGITLIPQGRYVAESLRRYLLRHPEMDAKLTRNSTVSCLTTESTDFFDSSAALFLGQPVSSRHISLG